MDIKELIERVELTPEEIDRTRQYNPSTSGCYKTDERAVAKAQLNKILNDPDLYVIDREKPGIKCFVDEALRYAIIPLREAIKEVKG